MKYTTKNILQDIISAEVIPIRPVKPVPAIQIADPSIRTIPEITARSVRPLYILRF